MDADAIIDDFFNQYASTMNNALFGGSVDASTIQNSFAKFIVGANPMGVVGGSNDDVFLSSIRQGIDFYKKIGIVSMNILSKEITRLDDFHAVVKICWSSFYTNETISGEIPFEVFYIIQIGSGGPRIFAYITGDEQAALRNHKLIS